jgi:hypothetical protein
MTMTHVSDVLDQHPELDFDLAFPITVGAGFVDPTLIAPREEQNEPDIEELIAFRCCL